MSNAYVCRVLRRQRPLVESFTTKESRCHEVEGVVAAVESHLN